MPGAGLDSDDSPLLGDGGASQRIRWQAKTPGTVVFLAAAANFCITSSGMLMLIPLYRLIEDAVCHAWYADDSPGLVDETRCKVDEVQSRLAFLLGWLALFNSVLNLLVAYPYGILADRIGRKPIAVMAHVGTAASLSFAPLLLGPMQQRVRENPYLLMLGSLFLLFGGGVPVLLSTLYAVAADVSTEQQKAASFLHVTFGATAGGLVGPLLAGLVMTRYGPWAPIYMVLALTPPMLCVFLLMPETLVREPARARRKPGRPMVDDVGEHVGELLKSLDMVKNKNIGLILVTFFFQSARFTAYTGTLPQYMSKHFGWRLAETSLLLSPLGLLNLMVLSGLPKVSQVLVSRRIGLSVFAKDLLLTRLSTLLIIVGALIQGLSRNVVLFMAGLFIGTLGAADSPLARATLSHYADAEHTSRLYAFVSMVEVLGAFIAGPALAWFFDQGLRRRGVWTGLPWLYIAALCGVALAALSFVRPPRAEGEGEGEGEGERAADGAGNEAP